VVPKPIVYTRSRRAAASSAAVTGSTPWVFAPSVSTTMVSGSKSAGGSPEPEPGSWTSTPVGGTSGLISAIASTAVRMPSPIAVPRDVLSPSSALSSASWSVVGFTSRPAIPEKTTTPILVPSPRSLTNSRAASRATVSRFGATSVEHIEVDTSTTSRIDVDEAGTVSVAFGRAAARPSASRPTTNRIAGIFRRHCDRPGSAARISATLDTRTASRRRRRISHHRTSRRTGTTSTASRAQGQPSDIQISLPYQRTISTPPIASRRMAAPESRAVSSTGSFLNAMRRSIDFVDAASDAASPALW